MVDDCQILALDSRLGRRIRFLGACKAQASETLFVLTLVFVLIFRNDLREFFFLPGMSVSVSLLTLMRYYCLRNLVDEGRYKKGFKRKIRVNGERRKIYTLYEEKMITEVMR